MTQKSLDVLVSLSVFMIDGEQSVVEALHMYSDKSHISLTASALDICAFHTTLETFFENCRRSHIRTERSITAYSQVKVYSEEGTSND